MAGGRDLSPLHCLMMAVFFQVAVLPDWDGGSRYQLALCKYNKGLLRERERERETRTFKDHFPLK